MPIEAARRQNEIRQAATACALERYRLAHGEYPDSLAALIPQYLDEAPFSAATLDPMRYQRAVDSYTITAAADEVWSPSDRRRPLRSTTAAGTRRIIRAVPP